MFIRQPSGYVKQAMGHVGLGFGKEVRAGEINVGWWQLRDRYELAGTQRVLGRRERNCAKGQVWWAPGRGDCNCPVGSEVSRAIESGKADNDVCTWQSTPFPPPRSPSLPPLCWTGLRAADFGFMVFFPTDGTPITKQFHEIYTWSDISPDASYKYKEYVRNVWLKSELCFFSLFFSAILSEESSIWVSVGENDATLSMKMSPGSPFSSVFCA